ncbi:hypothetical protein EXVG_00388 [Emiliania huxleyi virus 202]|nr:hypothetical protein EXVG_00388 [Emiliania huxleyi virus 202]AHA54347.1 hypothetical protein EhV18_00301 [Emiliania huxleyi virus 18]AHA55385.1 hypothetical protein EhV156_00290 [Emiliania huxleyi virus 156]
MEVWKLVLSAVIYVFLSYELTRKALKNTTRDLPMDIAAMRYKINTANGTSDSVLRRTRIGGLDSGRNRGVQIEELSDVAGINYPMVPYTGPRTQRRTTSVRRPPS